MKLSNIQVIKEAKLPKQFRLLCALASKLQTGHVSNDSIIKYAQVCKTDPDKIVNILATNLFEKGVASITKTGNPAVDALVRKIGTVTFKTLMDWVQTTSLESIAKVLKTKAPSKEETRKPQLAKS